MRYNAVSLFNPVNATFFLRHPELEMFEMFNMTIIRTKHWTDTLEIPIIENQDKEEDIAVDLETAVRDSPDVDVVLIRGHGVYVWGDTWQQAKVRIEALEWIFQART